MLNDGWAGAMQNEEAVCTAQRRKRSLCSYAKLNGSKMRIKDVDGSTYGCENVCSHVGAIGNKQVDFPFQGFSF